MSDYYTGETDPVLQTLRERNQARYLARQWMRVALRHAPDSDWLTSLIEESKQTDWMGINEELQARARQAEAKDE